MMAFAALIVTAAVIWFWVHMGQGVFTWRNTALVVPLIIMLVAAIISTSAASNKHSAMIAAVNLLTQIVLAILLVQLLDTAPKQRLMLCVLAATGLTMAYRCWEQHRYDNPQTIKMYAEDPQAALASQGLEPGTYQAKQFAARLQSRDVGGYFSVSNTAAAFFILSIMATSALLLEGCRSWRLPGQWLWLLAGALILAAQVGGVLLTRSKGGIVAWAAALLLLAALWCGRNYFRRHWRLVVGLAVALIVLVVLATVGHGLHYGRLPSNSMWLRWQYWQGAAAMIADHWFTGVGPQNFGQYYTHYIVPAAPEVVQDPHSFLLALWCEWGILGLAGFCAAILMVTIHLARPNAGTSDPTASQMEPPRPIRRPWLWGLIAAVGIAVIQLAVTDLPETSLIVRLSVYLINFVIPGVIWLMGFLLMAKIMPGKVTASSVSLRDSSIAVLVLGCGLLGFLLHNSIDFAIFHPAVGTYFFAAVAVAVAMRNSHAPAGKIKIAPTPSTRGVALIAGLALLAVLACKIVVPVVRGQRQLTTAQQWALRTEQFSHALPQRHPENTWHFKTSYLDQSLKAAAKASAINRHDPQGPYFQARLNFLRWQETGKKDDTLLQMAIVAFEQAIQRDPANFKYYQQVSKVYQTAAGIGHRQVRLEKALAYSKQAVERYPVKSELLIRHADLLHGFGRDNQAAQFYQRALQYEQAYLDQQLRMHPQLATPPPRLQPALRQWAEEQLRKLKSNQPPQPQP